MDLNVGLATSWRVRCGIASYSENLAMALSKLGVNVYIIRIPRFGNLTGEILGNVVSKIPVGKIDLIHIQHEYGIYRSHEKTFFPALKRLGLPIISTCHAVGGWETDKIIADFSDAVVVHNEFCFRRFNHPKNTGIIPHGATPLTAPPPPMEACKKSLGITPRTPIVGYLGFISSYKGLETLIEAMIKVPYAGLLVAGGWHTEQTTEYLFGLKEWTLKALPRRCQWVGYVSDEDLSRVYGAMNIVVYPSRFATESGALIQALSHRKAVVASNIKPFKEKERVGALTTFKTGSALSLRRKIKRLLKDEELRLKLEEGAGKYAEATSWPKMAERHIRLYQQVLEK